MAQILRKPILAAHVARRVRLFQPLSRFRRRFRHLLLTAGGIRVLPKQRTCLADDWESRISAWQAGRPSESPWQELPGRLFTGSPAWLAFGPRVAGRYSSELPRLEL